ncbi:hypothetical protein K7A41_00130 [Sphingobacterium sp. InxBP1]|uniref:hypothetical protein n=1 Tax=Sphingobacterium sp. InxBP1 TaxID=2870328 RepID=UPI00224339F2|nr:hypothetical protein [Sphingobacterium sp. InxBP1]MCW8309633.1 hypothetical protein [Sphingobacterium sp. InxBP1]
MKTLQEIKDEVAIEDGYTSWEQVGAMGVSDWMVDEIAKRFALEVAKESLRNAAENAEAEYLCYKAPTVYDDSGHSITVNKESILSENNIPKL